MGIAHEVLTQTHRDNKLETSEITVFVLRNLKLIIAEIIGMSVYLTNV